MTSSTTSQQIRDTVRRFALEHDLFKPGGLVVAVSGGVDSTALLLLLADLAPGIGLVLHVAHFDHRLRRTGAADAQFVSGLAARVGATIRAGRAERAPKSEDDARRARYEFLERVAADTIGHHLDQRRARELDHPRASARRRVAGRPGGYPGPKRRVRRPVPGWVSRETERDVGAWDSDAP
ncbi:MAG: hypothetical protein HYY42_07010 [Chloroflexi bacterium]|nr:hypothetical protein [Chloroflexota bacterium]